MRNDDDEGDTSYYGYKCEYCEDALNPELMTSFTDTLTNCPWRDIFLRAQRIIIIIHSAGGELRRFKWADEGVVVSSFSSRAHKITAVISSSAV